MSSAASVGGDERLRLFLGLRLADPDLDLLTAWQRGRLDRMRVLPRDHLHVTLAFLGHRPAGELPAIADVLREAAARVDGETRLTPVRYRETRSVAMLVLDDEDGRARALALDLHERLEQLGVYRRERRDWLPHLTVGRFRERPRLRVEPPGGTFVPSDAAAYLSRLRPGGAQYAVLESIALGA
jgi:RNA 2',3'-cyclic 3'-phosphodiesterase